MLCGSRRTGGRPSRRRHAARVAALAASSLAWTACDGHRSEAGPASLAGSVALRNSYEFEGRPRHVDAQIALDNVIDPYRGLVTATDPGERLVAVRLRLLNHGRDPFPLEWARFKGYDVRGRALAAGTQSTPLRKSLPDRPVRGQTLTSLMAFRVPERRKLASVRMTSVVELWAFRGRWRLKQ
jgi:hypothetical protein